MSKGKIDIGTEVSTALIGESVKTQVLQNEIVKQLTILEGTDGVPIEKPFVEAVAQYVKANKLNNFSLDDLNAVMIEQGKARPVSLQETGQGLKEAVEKRLAEHFYNVSERYGVSYKAIADGNSEDAKFYQTPVQEIAAEIKAAFTKGSSMLDIIALQDLVSDLCNVNIGEGMVVLATKRSALSPDKIETNSTRRFNLMAQETARRALGALKPAITDSARINQLAETIIEAGSGFKKLGGDLFRDFQFAVRSDIGMSETPIKMLHELPEIQAIAQKMAGKDFTPAKNALSIELNQDKEKYIFGRKEIAKESVKLVVNKAVDASVAQLAEVSNDPYLKAAAAELKSKMAHDVSDSFSKKVKSELVEEFMRSYISTRTSAEGSQMTIENLAMRLAHPVGKGLLEAAISSALLDRKQTLETVSKGLINQISDGWTALKAKAGRGAASALEATGVAVSPEVLELLKGKEVGAVAVASKALEAFIAFDPDNKTTYPAADKLKVDTQKAMTDRTERFAQASKAVDLMVTTEMRNNRLQPKFSLHPRVRERLVRYLYETPGLDQVSFCKSLCDSFIQRGKANKTFTLAHFEPKGDRTQGTFKEYFRKKLQSLKKWLKNTKLGRWLPELPNLFTPSTAAFDLVLNKVENIVKTGITPPRLYTSHRDAQTAVIDAISMFNGKYASNGGMILVKGKSLPPIAIDKDVRAALVKQVTIELEKARIEGKKIFLSDISDALQPGMEELAQKGRDLITGEITAKTVKDSVVSAGVVPGYMKPNTHDSQSLEDFCKDVVNKEVMGVYGTFSIKDVGMTRDEVLKAVLKDAMDGQNGPGKADVEKSLKKAIDAALKTYYTSSEQAIYTQALIRQLKQAAKDSVELVEVPPKKEGGEPTFKLSVKETGPAGLSAVADQLGTALKKEMDVLEEKRKQAALGSVEKSGRAQYPAVITLPNGSMAGAPVSSLDAKKQIEKLLPTLNNAKAFLEHIVKYGKDEPEYCKQLINDPKYAEILHYSRFSDKQGPKQLGSFLEAHKLVNLDMIRDIQAQQQNLAANLRAFPEADIKQIAENINIMKRADVFSPNNDDKGLMEALLAGNALVVEGVAAKPVILVATDPMVRGKAEELLRFLHNHEDKDTATLKTLAADFVKSKKITSQDIRDSEVNGRPLNDYIKANQGLDVSAIKVEAVQERGAHLSGVLEGKSLVAKSKVVAAQIGQKAAEAALRAAAIPPQQQSGWLSGAARVIRKVPLGSRIVGPDPTPGHRSGGQGQGK